MEAAFCCLALEEGFTPISANIKELDPEFAPGARRDRADRLRAENRDVELERLRRNQRLANPAPLGRSVTRKAKAG